MKNFDALLVFPPSVLAETMPVSLAALTAYLRRAGIVTEQQDWNALFNQYAFDQVDVKVLEGAPISREKDISFIKNYFLHYVAGAYFSDLKPETWCTLPKRMNSDSSIWSPPYPFSYMQFLEGILDDFTAFERFVMAPYANIYHRYYESVIRPSVCRAKLVGFSIVSYAQVVPAATLSFLLRRDFPDIHVCWGGPWVTSFCHIFAPRLDQMELLHNLVDSFVVREGEEPLLRLIRSVLAGETPRSVENTWLRGTDGRWCRPESDWMADMRLLPVPDYTDFDPTLYTSFIEGHGSVVIQGSRSCYHMKCAFCNAITNLAPKYRERPVEMIRADIERVLGDVPSATVVDFADAVFPARRLRSIGEFFIARGNPDLQWEIDVRFEKNITADLIALIHKSGGLLRFGLETASERLLTLVEKGNKKEVVRRILEDSRQVGFKPFLMTIVGLPSETLEDVHALADFLTEFSDTSTFQIADFMVEYGSPIHRDPERFGIRIPSGQEDKLSHHIPFTRLTGYDDETARHVFPGALSAVLRRVHGAGAPVIEPDADTRRLEIRFKCGTIEVPPTSFIYNGRPFSGVVAIGYALLQAVTNMEGSGLLLEESSETRNYADDQRIVGLADDPALPEQGIAMVANPMPTRGQMQGRCAAG